MRIVRYTAAAATVLMGLMNLPFAFDTGENDIPTALAWLITLLGVAGLAAAAGLLARRSWGPPTVVAVGALNVVGAVVALALGGEGAVIGLAVSAVGTGLGIATARMPVSRSPQTA